MFLCVRNSGAAQLASSDLGSHDEAVNVGQGCFLRSLDGGWQTHSKVARSHEGKLVLAFGQFFLYVIGIGILEGPDSMAPGFSQREHIKGPKLQDLLGPTLRSYTVTSTVFYGSHRSPLILHRKVWQSKG